MSIQISNESPPVQLTHQATIGQNHDTRPAMSGKPHAAEDSVAFSALGERQRGAQNVADAKSQFVEIGRIFKQADAAMGAIEGHLTKMKKQLEGIVKNYPPFPIGSDERVRMLKSFNSLRHQIDQLTIPPPPKPGTEGAKILADPSTVPGAGDTVVALGNNGPQFEIKAQQVHSGATGLNIPALPDTPPDDATDEQIYTALGNLETAGDILRQRKDALVENATQVAQEYLVPGGMSESAARDKSFELKQQFSEMEFPGLIQSDQRWEAGNYGP